MKTFLFAMMVAMVAVLAAACGDETTVIEGPVPVEVTGTVEFVPPPNTCITDDDCDEMEICWYSKKFTEKAGYQINICVLGCEAEFAPVENEDGTSFNPKKPGTDTCQRFGNMDLYCDWGKSNKCKEYTQEEPVVEPDTDVTPDTEPDLTPEPDVEPVETNMTEVKCCYAGNLAGLYGVITWSASTPDDPEAWIPAMNLTIDEDGCFNNMVDLDTVFLGFWVDMTYGKTEGKDWSEIDWVAEKMKPTACSFDGKAVPIGTWDNGWMVGEAAGK